MPWLSVLVWLVSFFLISSARSVGLAIAASLATGLAICTDFLADPSDPDSYLELGNWVMAIGVLAALMSSPSAGSTKTTQEGGKSCLG